MKEPSSPDELTVGLIPGRKPWIEDEQGNVLRPFPGFYAPRYTQVPDDVFDKVMPHLTEAELKVLLYVTRRTAGFKKDADAIRLKQFTGGISHLNGGVGLGKSAVQKALKSLQEKGLIVAERRQDPTKGTLPTVYRLKIR